jgi:hypothetical protein
MNTARNNCAPAPKPNVPSSVTGDRSATVGRRKYSDHLVPIYTSELLTLHSTDRDYTWPRSPAASKPARLAQLAVTVRFLPLYLVEQLRRSPCRYASVTHPRGEPAAGCRVFRTDGRSTLGGRIDPPQPSISPSVPPPPSRVHSRVQVEYPRILHSRPVCGTRSGASAPRPRLSSVPFALPATRWPCAPAAPRNRIVWQSRRG